MNPQPRKHHVIIVHYGPAETTMRLVNGLLEDKLPPDSVTVVDHDPFPFPSLANNRCQTIRPGGNLGYAAGVNMGLGAIVARSADPDDLVTCVNNDVEVLPGSFSLVRRWWSEHPQPALVGFTTKQDPEEHAGGYVNLLTGRCQLSSLPAKLINKTKSIQLRYIHGAFMSAPLRVFLTNRGLPEKYFMYWEDVLFSRQLAAEKIPLTTSSVVVGRHASQQTDKNVTSDKLYYLVRNGALFLEQDSPPLWRLYWFVANRLRYLYHRLNRSQKPEVAQALKDAIRGVTGQRAANYVNAR